VTQPARGRLTAGASEQEPIRLTQDTSHALAEKIARICEDKLARDIVILDMRSAVGYTDELVICTGQNSRQTQAIAEEVALRLKHEDGLLPRSGEGQREGEWILLDFLDVVLHVFTPDARAFYRLEQLWGQVPVRELA
jgi:ribosome-associated protein